MIQKPFLKDYFDLEIGLTICRIYTEDTFLLNELKQKYYKWTTNKEPNFKIKIIYSRSRSSPIQNLSSFIKNISFKYSNSKISLSVNNSKMYFNGNNGKFFLAENNYNRFLILSLVTAFSFYFLKENAFFFHSSAIEHNNKAYLFSGPSGYGKSTIAKLSKFKIIGEETILLKKINNIYYAFSTPFKDVTDQNIGFPVEKIFFIHKSKKNKIIDVSSVERITYLYESLVLTGHMHNCKFLGKEKLTRHFLDKLISDLSRVKCYNLKFNKSIDVQEHIFCSHL